MRDPHNKLTDDQLNGGEFQQMTKKDWKLIEPYLKTNEELFHIPIDKLLEVNGEQRLAIEVYRKIAPKRNGKISAEEAWVAKH